MLSLGWFIAGLLLGAFIGSLLVGMAVVSDLGILYDKINELRDQLDDCKNREVFGELYDAGREE